MRVSKEPIRHEVPHEEGEWFDLVKLSWKQLKKARKKATMENAETAKAFGAELIHALSSSGGEEKARRLLKNQQYDESQFDTEALLTAGIVGWSYDGEPTPDAVAELDEETATWAKQALIDLTKPPSEDEEKNS